MQIPGVNYFKVQEFLHPNLYAYISKGDNLERWRWFVSDFQINYAVLLREVLAAPIVINTWHSGGAFVGRGTRPVTYRPQNGALYSQHYLAKALDVSCPAFKPIQILSKIEANWDKFSAIGLTTIENPRITKTWLHGDCREWLPGVHPEVGPLIVEP